MLKKAALALLCSFSPFLYGASFDCAKANLPTEKAICNDPYLSGLDESVASAYKSAMQTTNDASSLKASQVAWIVQTRACGSDSANINTCLADKYSARLAELRGLGQAKSVDTVELKPAAEPIPATPTEQSTVPLKPVSMVKATYDQESTSDRDILSIIMALVMTSIFGLSPFLIRLRSLSSK